MAGNLINNPRLQYPDQPGGTLEFWDNDAHATPLATYSDKDLTVANENPVNLDSAGRPSLSGNVIAVNLLQQSYYVVLKNAAGTEIWDADDVSNILQIDITGVPEADTVAAMTALTKASLTNLVIYQVNGRTTKGDGGGGKFQWNSASTATVDLGSVFASDEGGTGRWLRIYDSALRAVWFDMIGDDSTDDDLAWQSLLTASSDAAVGIILETGKIYLVSNGVIKDAVTVPAFIEGQNATLKAKTGTTGILLDIENPQETLPDFYARDFMVDGDQKTSTGIHIKGLKRCNLSNIWCFDSTGVGWNFEGRTGFGIFGCQFDNLKSGKTGASNGGDGFNIKSTETGNFIAANTWNAPVSHKNQGHGFDIDWCQDTFNGPWAEQNDGYGWNLGNTFGLHFVGGYSEHNHQNWGVNGAAGDDATDDESFNMTSDSTGVKIFGGRHIGAIIGTTTGTGNLFLQTNHAWSLMYDEDGLLTVNDIKVRTTGGIGIGATPTADDINFLNDWTISRAGTTIFGGNATEVKLIKPARVENTNAKLYAGASTPEGAVTANIGSLFLRTDGGAGTTLYVKESGSGNTGWAGV